MNCGCSHEDSNIAYTTPAPSEHNTNSGEPKYKWIFQEETKSDLAPPYIPPTTSYPDYAAFSAPSHKVSPAKTGMSSKMITALIMFIVSAVSLLFLPFIQVSIFGYSNSLILINHIEDLAENMFDSALNTGVTISLFGSFLGFFGSYAKSKATAILSSVIGIIGIALIYSSLSEGLSFTGNALEFLGIGIYIAFISYVVALIVSITDI